MDKGSNRPGDWWSLGVLVYEMIYGIPPFYSTNIQKMYKNTLLNSLKFKKHTECSHEARDFMAGLLIKDPRKRLGSTADINEIMAHPWFKGFDWQALKEKQLAAPYIPSGCGDNWERHFDPEFMKMKAKDSICITNKTVIDPYESRFSEFEFVDQEFEVESLKESRKDYLSTKVSENDNSLSNDMSHYDISGFGILSTSTGGISKVVEGLKKNKSEGNECERVCAEG